MTRIIAGLHRGRRLIVPEGRGIRPTTDRMRERLFSMLSHGRYPDMAEAQVADLFAGTGALGLEALSRGAAFVTFVENAAPSLKIIKDNISALKAEADTKVLRSSATQLPLIKTSCDFIFMDPPYRQGFITPSLQSLLQQGWLAKNGVIICELATDNESPIPEALSLVDERRQGQQRILFLQHAITTVQT